MYRDMVSRFGGTLPQEKRAPKSWFSWPARRGFGIPMASDGQIGNPAIYPAKMAGSLYPDILPDILSGPAEAA